MSSSIATKKRLLTVTIGKLERILTALKQEKLEDTSLDPDLPDNVRLENMHGLEEGICAVEYSMAKVEQTLSELAALFDNVDPSGKEPTDLEEYTTRSETILNSAFDYLLILRARLRILKSMGPQPLDVPPESDIAAPVTPAKTKTLDLPPIPIPTFAGNIWEWDNFWEIFNTNIHSQEVADMVKFNYLLNALKGEARNSIRKFQVTGDNYHRAIQFLHNKYNNRDVLINALVEKLDNCSLRGQSTQDQRHLLEELQVIITQLEEKGEGVNNSWLIKKVLCKFPDSLKRKVIMKKQGLSPATSFTMSLLLQYLDEVITAEEMILMFTESKTKQPIRDNISSRNKPSPKGPIKGVCMYCKGFHPSHACMKYPTPQERSAYLRQRNLCLICASPTHNTAHCKGRMCFSCGGAHHTSCCFKSTNKANNPSRPSNTQETGGAVHRSTTAPQKDTGRDNKARKKIKTRSNAIATATKGSPPSDSGITCVFCKRYGQHYSDSCPSITDGNERFQYIRQENLCQYCLGDDHDYNNCRAAGKQCWYCDIVRNTPLSFLICDDGGHHRALCNIPDSRDRVSRRIKAVRDRLHEVKYQ